MKNKNNIFRLFFAGLLLVLSSCAASGPLFFTENPIGSKVGKSEAVSILGFPPFGDASIKAAAKNGKITKVATVDTQVKSGCFTNKFVTIVTGE